MVLRISGENESRQTLHSGIRPDAYRSCPAFDGPRCSSLLISSSWVLVLTRISILVYCDSIALALAANENALDSVSGKELSEKAIETTATRDRTG